MTTMERNACREELAQFILHTENNSLLDKIRRLINRENKKEAEAENTEAGMTKEEVMADLREAFQLAKLAKEGKAQGRPFEELLHEL